ncbi:hypothetical protein D3C72_2055900 [compost metagenome]
MQDDQTLLLIEADIHRRMGVEADQCAIGQAQAALFTRGGTLIGQPVAYRLIGTGPAQQSHHQRQAGNPTAEFAYALAQVGARLQQGLARWAGCGAEALVEHAQLRPGPGVLFTGGMPAVEFGALVSAAAA